MHDALHLEPGTLVAGFLIEETLASGGFGTVYRALRDGRRFALKLLPLEDPRSEREMDALRRQRHPNVVGFQGWGLWPDEAPRYQVLTLEYVEGRTLEAWADEENPSALELVHQVLLPFVLLLADVHDSGVVHRDVKETNILVRRKDGQPVLVDFGAACHEGAKRLTPRLPPGTPEYRSPELLRSAREWTGEPLPVSPRDDLWALGVTLYWLLTRTMPFGDRHGALTQTILHQTPPAPQVLNPRVPPALGDVCMRMLEKDPEARYPDARALAQALSEAWSHADRSWNHPLLAPRPPPEPPLHPEPPPVVPERRSHLPWAITMGLALVLFSVTPRHEWSEPRPPPQAGSRQEMAAARMTGEVVRDAEPRTSPRKDTDMKTSPKVRSVTRAALLAGAACVAPGCATMKFNPPPPPTECPPGAAATHERFRFMSPDVYRNTNVVEFVREKRRREKPITVEEGDIKVLTLGYWGELPDKTTLVGKLYFTREKIYGRFTEAHLDDGEVVPICMELKPEGGGSTGIRLPKGSTPHRASVSNNQGVRLMKRFEYLNWD